MISALPMILCCISRIGFSQITIEPLSLTITPAEQTATAGAIIKVKAKLTNLTDHVITFFDTNSDCDYLTEVRGDSGNPAPETAYKRQLQCSDKSGDSRNILVSLKPREAIGEEILVSRLYELRRPGNYTVQVSRRVPKGVGKGPIKSNVVTITVTE